MKNKFYFSLPTIKDGSVGLWSFQVDVGRLGILILGIILKVDCIF